MEAHHFHRVHAFQGRFGWYVEKLFDLWPGAEEVAEYGDVVIDEPVDRQIGGHTERDEKNKRRKTEGQIFHELHLHWNT